MDKLSEIEPEKSQNRLIAPGLMLGCLALLAVILYPHFMPACGCAEPSQKINMHKLQTMLENYAVDWGGVYPENVKQLETTAKNVAQPYWIEISNPVSKAKGLGKAYGDVNSPPVFGMVVYVPHGSPITTYAIYAYQDAKLEFIQDKGLVFFLSNS
ncbi:MAG: hypothetical protein IV090_22515 [Candidatus Sericytochromatia bacterium]|nr:hypothetical protein [Candidatus Sericytochromatia bacterium]